MVEPDRRIVIDPRYLDPPISSEAVPRVKVVLSATVRVVGPLTSLIFPAAPALTTHVPAEKAPPPPLNVGVGAELERPGAGDEQDTDRGRAVHLGGALVVVREDLRVRPAVLGEPEGAVLGETDAVTPAAALDHERDRRLRRRREDERDENGNAGHGETRNEPHETPIDSQATVKQ